MKHTSQQRGATLVIALIFLILMTLFAINAFNSSNSNLRVVGNTQVRQESLAAAQVAIEDALSNDDFVKNPDGVAKKDIQVDVDGNGEADYTAKLSPPPQCYRAKPILASDLPEAPKNPAMADPYAPCRAGQRAGGTFIDRETPLTGTDPESCANSEWNVRAEVTDPKSHAYVAVNQGVGVVVFGNEVSSYCK